MNDQIPPADGFTVEYSKITEQIYLGSDLCSPEVCKLHGPVFAQLGITTEISLTAELKDTPTDMVTYCWIPVVDNMAPSVDQFDLGTQIINTVVNQGGKIYIHCRLGHGRSPTMLAAYFIRFKGLSDKQALEFVQKGRSEAHPTQVQLEALEKYFQTWSK